ncbi:MULTISPECIES: hypothetical protein [unclassified Devosia]|uniref:hypothetical protein n=1 Tax=unclassified Devosia TaxID=196773 RepID=UPI0015FADCB7|nr:MULTISPECIES: hypothetical protein [unclassified Devosia]MBJ6986945.1 hypothetical protein [Devosia sp. MC521]MBK1793358.1 hypothetical protein [Devosia sp. WQ 349K1]QMW63969.1 hypothetical protein H4N61_06535 [Devosia sp. MC521]
MSRIYAAGAAMGWTAQEVDRTSMWKFWAAWHGYVRANSPQQNNKLSETEKDRIWARMQEMDTPEGVPVTVTYLWDGATFLPQIA